MKKDTNKHSSYWLNKDLFDGDTSPLVSDEERKSTNLMALASYKKAIGNFVNIVTNDNIKVKFNERGDSYTDGETVTISAKMDAKDFDSTVGLALHEGSHIKLTDFNTLTDLHNHTFPHPLNTEFFNGVEDKYEMTYSGARNYTAGIVKNLINIIEDRRIDYYIYSTSPGYKGYYHAMYDKYFNAKIVDKGLQSSEYRDTNWDSYMFRIINITNENRDLDALPLLRLIFDMIDLKNIDRLKSTTDVFKLACEIFKIVEDTLPTASGPNSSPDGEGDESEDTDGTGQGNGGDNSEADGTDTTESSGNGTKDGSDGVDDTKGDAEGDDVKKGTSSYNPNGAGGDGSDNQIADVESTTTSGDGYFTDRQKKQLENAIEKQNKFQDGDITKKKVSKAESKKLDVLSNAGIENKMVGKDYTTSNHWQKSNQTAVMVVRNFSKQLAESDTISMLSTYEYRTDRNQKDINTGIQIGTMLGKKLKLRSEERSLITPRMKTGKISGRLLHELGMGNTNIFDQTVINKHNPAFVHISIDASSSMGGAKWSNSQIAAVAIAKAASMTTGLDVVISYRSIEGYTNQSIQPLMLVAYDSRKDKFTKIQQLFQYINPCGTTPEGLCFEAILDDIVKTNNGVESYFINFSDGHPGFQNNDVYYCGGPAILHTAMQVKKMQNAGVTVLSYFITNQFDSSYGLDSFKHMYGKSAQNVNVTSLIPLAQSLNKMFQ
tara:strand:+ start:697 stop:2847 length:2151 start_codon:yes stop_codon:yes gene_type:complete